MTIETQYFPPIDTFILASKYNSLIIEQHENYQKKGYRNRCHLLGANGSLRLSIPLHKGKNQKLSITDVKISYEEDWVKSHQQSILSCYGSSPYYIYYVDAIFNILEKKYENLYLLNAEILRFFCNLLNIPFSSTDHYSKIIEQDFRSLIKPNQHFISNKYYEQVFADTYTFRANLSILDALFCLGPELSIYLKSQTDIYENKSGIK